MEPKLQIDPDVLADASAVALESGKALSDVVNEALRAGLPRLRSGTASRPYRTVAKAMGLRRGFDVDNIQAVLEATEGPNAR